MLWFDDIWEEWVGSAFIDNNIDQVEQLSLNNEDVFGTHPTVRQIANESNIHAFIT